MNTELIILPKIGLKTSTGTPFDKLVFGTPIDDVVAILGQADDKESYHQEDELFTTMLVYELYEIALFFEEIDKSTPKLGDIEIENENTILYDTKIFGMNKEDFIRLMMANGHSDSDYSIDYDGELGEECISFEDVSMDFYFFDNKLVSVNYTVPFI